MISEKDIEFREHTYEMPASQPDFKLAKRLFPEAEILPIRWSDDIPLDQQRGFYEIRPVE
jgi:hypothetical protein